MAGCVDSRSRNSKLHAPYWKKGMKDQCLKLFLLENAMLW